MQILYIKVILIIYIVAIAKKNFVFIVLLQTFVIIYAQIVLTTIRKYFIIVLF